MLTELLFLSIILIGMMFAAVYINEHVQHFGMRKPFIANAGIVLGVLASVICIALQTILFLAERVDERTTG